MNRQVSSVGATSDRLAAAALAAVLLLATMLFGATPSHATTIEDDVENSIVLVGTSWEGYVEYPAEGGGTDFAAVEAASFCTGWFASAEAHIVTAGHCVDPDGGKEALIVTFLQQEDAMHLLDDALLNWNVDNGEGKEVGRTITVIQPNTVKDAVIDRATRATVLDFDSIDDGDVALLQAQGVDEETTPLAIAEQRPAVRTEVTAIGFPDTVSEVSDDARPSYKTGTVSSHQVRGGVAGIEINAELGKGMSGGPTINEDGEVVGVNSFKATANNEANFNFVTDTRNLQSFLKQNSVPINVAQPRVSAEPTGSAEAGAPIDVQRTEDAGGGVPPWVWVVLAVLVLAGLAFWLLKKNNALPAFAGGRSNQANAVSPAPAAPAVVRCTKDHENPVGRKFCGDCGEPLGDKPAS